MGVYLFIPEVPTRGTSLCLRLIVPHDDDCSGDFGAISGFLVYQGYVYFSRTACLTSIIAFLLSGIEKPFY